MSVRHRQVIRSNLITNFFINVNHPYQYYQPNVTYGSNVISNGNFSSWTGDNPSSPWSVSNESGGNVVTERDPNQLNADVKTVGGAANFFSTTNNVPQIFQTNVLTVDKIYQVDTEMTARATGNFAFTLGFVSQGSGDNNNFTTVVNTRRTKLCNNTTFQLGVGVQPTNLTLDNVDVREIILDTAITTPVNHTVYYLFQSNAPASLEEIIYQYRMPNAGDEMKNGFILYLQRRAGNTNWNIRADSLISSNRTNKLVASSIGALINGFKVNVNGNVHTIHYFNNGVLTLLGSFTDSTFNTATRVNIIPPQHVTNNQVIVVS